MLPKETGRQFLDKQRPVTITSSLYRLWARAHYMMLKQRIVALECSVEAGTHVSGVSYDLSKAFDRIQRGVLWPALERMRVNPVLISTHHSYYRGHVRRLRFRRCVGAPFHTAN
eukprot:3568559-Amphidinium_carterae.1